MKSYIAGEKTILKAIGLIEATTKVQVPHCKDHCHDSYANSKFSQADVNKVLTKNGFN